MDRPARRFVMPRLSALGNAALALLGSGWGPLHAAVGQAAGIDMSLVCPDALHPGFIKLQAAQVIRLSSDSDHAPSEQPDPAERQVWIRLDHTRWAQVVLHCTWVRSDAIEAIDEGASSLPLGNPFAAPTFAATRPGPLALPISRGFIVSVGTGRIFTGVTTDGSDPAVTGAVLALVADRLGLPSLRAILDLVAAGPGHGLGREVPGSTRVDKGHAP